MPNQPNQNRGQSNIGRDSIASRPSGDTNYRMILGIIVTGIVVSCLLCQTLRWQELRLIREEFKQRSADRFKTVASQFKAGVTLGRLGAASMRSLPAVTRSQFRALAGPLLSEAGPLHAVGWNRRVRVSELAAYIAAEKSQNPDYKVRQLQPGGTILTIDPENLSGIKANDLFVVEAIEPHKPNQAALGLDIASEPTRRAALDRACNTGESTVSGRIRLVQEVGTQFGTLVISPVYRDDATPRSPEHRRENVVGVFVCVYRIGDVVEAAMKNLEPAGVDVHLFDESASPGRQLLYSHSSRLRTNPMEATQSPAKLQEQEFIERAPFEFGGRNWVFYCTPVSDFVANRRTWLPIIVFGLGNLIAVLIAAYIFGQNRLNIQLRREMVVRAEAEEHLRESEQRFRHVARLSTMGEMVAGIAHELNQPLAAIANFSAAASKLLQKSNRSSEHETLEKWLLQIRTQSIRCGDIIRRLRGFVTKDNLNWELVDLNQVVRDSVALIASDRRQFASCIDCQLPDAPPKIRGSEVQLQQVLVNLLLNACDSLSNTEEPLIRISIDVMDDAVRISVLDNGPGIDEKQRTSLFDPFFTTKSKGMGMGLAISRSIIESHQGKMSLASKVGPGALFHVQLPIPSVAAEEIS